MTARIYGFDLDKRGTELLTKLEHLFIADGVSDLRTMAYIAHEFFIDRGLVAPVDELLETFAGFFPNIDAARHVLTSPLPAGHVRIVVLCEDAVRFAQLPIVPLARGGAC
ncbi:MAG: hypothetical protein KF795_17835 [Labilithrix sp.]|nr:hypothetical protein [Labilithrix sp.]